MTSSIFVVVNPAFCSAGTLSDDGSRGSQNTGSGQIRLVFVGLEQPSELRENYSLRYRVIERPDRVPGVPLEVVFRHPRCTDRLPLFEPIQDWAYVPL